MNEFINDGQWQTVFSENTDHFMPCICGHRVKRITYIYHRPTKTVGYIGKTCVKKYGIQTKVSNAILIAVIKDHINGLDGSTRIDDLVRAHILEKYGLFMTKIGEHDDIEIDYYDIVAPFRRLLNDVCDLVSEYEFDLVDLLKEIERGVESMNQTTKHTMVDEVDSSMESLGSIPEVSVSDSGREVYDENNDINRSVELSFDIQSDISIGSLNEEIDEFSYKESLGPYHEDAIDYEDDFEEEQEEANENLDEVLEEGQKEFIIIDNEMIDLNKMPEPCCCMTYCYCIIKYRLWKMRQELNKHKDTLESIRNETALLVKNTEIFRCNLRKSLE
jgi:hypothetical protein